MESVPDNGATIVGAMWTMTATPLVILLLRLYCKYRLSKAFGWDDWILIVSWLLLTVYTICITVSVTLGVGKHVVDIDPANISPALKLVYIGEFMVIIGCSLSKTCFAVTLLRTVTQKWQKMLLWWIIVSMNIVMGLCAILYLAQCQPTAHLWDFSIPAKCWDPAVMTYYTIAAGSYSGLMDFVLAMLPWTIVWNLQMKHREKVGVGVAMSLGVFAGVTAIIKTSYLRNIGLQQDFTFYCSSILIWAATETGVTIIAVSIPYLRTLIRGWHSTAYYGGASSGHKDHSNSYQLDAKPKHTSHRSRIYGGGVNHWADNEKDLERTVIGHADDESDRSILGAAEREGKTAYSGVGTTASKGIIKKTNEVSVTYEAREGREKEVAKGGEGFDFGTAIV